MSVFVMGTRVFILLLSAFIFQSCNLPYLNDVAELQIVNKSSELITRVSVAVCDVTFIENNVKVSEARMITFKIKRDCDYQVDVIFESKKMLEVRDGYLSGGFNYKDQALVMDNRIEIKQNIL